METRITLVLIWFLIGAFQVAYNIICLLVIKEYGISDRQCFYFLTNIFVFRWHLERCHTDPAVGV